MTATLASGPPPVLASGSPTRLAMLTEAGVPVAVDPALVDEEEIKQSCHAAGLDAADAAEALAELKARRTAGRHRGRLVIGADQMLECDGRWFDKPVDRDAARRQLADLRGRRHRLVSAAVVVRDDQRLWHAVTTAELTMRPFSDAFLDRYLDVAGADVLGSVGAYRIEGLGAQLFERVSGDHFTILGLPLLPLLDFLRIQGVLPA